MLLVQRYYKTRNCKEKSSTVNQGVGLLKITTRTICKDGITRPATNRKTYSALRTHNRGSRSYCYPARPPRPVQIARRFAVQRKKLEGLYPPCKLYNHLDYTDANTLANYLSLSQMSYLFSRGRFTPAKRSVDGYGRVFSTTLLSPRRRYSGRGQERTGQVPERR